MKVSNCLLACTLLFIRASAELDCTSQISRTENEAAACSYFEGTDADSYLSWYSDNVIDSKYTGMVYLQGSDPSKPEDGAAIHWKVDGEYVHLAVAVRATGWFGFGIAEAGGMLGADMALFEAAKPEVIVDAYTMGTRLPQVDDCKSDWDLISSNVDLDGGFMMVEFKRLLDTGDSQDKAIFNDASNLIPPHRVIAAWGNDEQVGYHRLNRARGAIRFFGAGDDWSTFQKVVEESSEGSFLVASESHEIAAIETEYAYNCFSRDDLIEQGAMNTTDLLNIIAFEPIIQEGNVPYVHHYIIYGSQDSECSDDGFDELVYVWAPGEGPLTLPENLGTPLFGEDGFQAFEIEIHYNNPEQKAGIIDSSGVRVHWTSQPRDEQIGILSVGDPNVSLEGQPVGDGLSTHSFECPGSCSSLVSQPVTVLREYLHMHESGERIVNEQLRSGEVLRQGTVDFWEFDQNGNAVVQQDPFVVQPGDGFRTTCYFRGNDRVFGPASSEEMCMAFLYYYPRLKVRVEEWDFEFPWTCGYQLGFAPCDTDYRWELLSSTADFHREFGVQSDDKCSVPSAPTDGALTDSTPTQAPSSAPNSDDSNSGAVAWATHMSLLAVLVLGLLFC